MKTFHIDSEIADLAEQELLSIKVPWEYMPHTASYYYDNPNSKEGRPHIDQINLKYGPIKDFHKFTWGVFNEASPTSKDRKFVDMRYDSESFYNKRFPNFAKLVDNIQATAELTHKRIIKLYVNMFTVRPSWSLLPPHKDYHNSEFETVLYYANNSDGDTYVFDGSECVLRASPEKGKGIVFPSSMLHCGSAPVNNENRVAINIVFAPKIVNVKVDKQ